MINTIVIEEMLLQLKQNENYVLIMRNRIRITGCPLKRAKFRADMQQAKDCVQEISDMLVLEYSEGISTQKLYKEING